MSYPEQRIKFLGLIQDRRRLNSSFLMPIRLRSFLRLDFFYSFGIRHSWLSLSIRMPLSFQRRHIRLLQMSARMEIPDRLDMLLFQFPAMEFLLMERSSIFNRSFAGLTDLEIRW